MYLKLEDLTKNIKGNEVLKNINLELDGPCIYGFLVEMGLERQCYLELYLD